MRYLVWMLLLLGTACIRLGDVPAPQHYYLLESLAPPVAIYPDTTASIVIEVADLAPYLDRPQVAVRKADRQISYPTDRRWAEPLRDHLPRILRENLSLQLPEARIFVAPWDNPDQAQRRVQLFVNDFTGIPESHSEVNIRWRILAGEQLLKRGHFTAQETAGGGYADLIQALNRAFDNLSRQLAAQLAG